MIVTGMACMSAVLYTGHDSAVRHGMGGVMGVVWYRLRRWVMMLMFLHI